MVGADSAEHWGLKFAANPRSVTTFGNEEETWEQT
jgi:hypothetical protein